MKSHLTARVVFVFLSIIAANAAALTIQQQTGFLNNKLKTAQGSEKVEILLKLASLCQYDSTKLAIGFSRQAIAAGEKLQDSYPLAKAYVSLASLFLRTGHITDSAWFYFNAAEKAFASSASGMPDANYFHQMASYHLRTRDTTRAVAMSQIAVEKAVKVNDHLTAALAEMNLGRISRKNGDNKRFVEWLGMAEKSFMLCEEKFLAGPPMISLGILYKDAGLHVMGDKVLINATAFCEQSGDSIYLGYLYCNVAGIFLSGPDPDKTLAFLKKAVAIFHTLNNDKGLGYALNHLGMYNRDHKKFDEAVSCFSQAMSYKINAGDWQGACFAACNKAEVFMEMRKYDDLTETFREAEQWMLKAGDKLSATVYYNTYGKFLVQNREYTDALTSFSTSLRYARESLNYNFVIENLKHIADLYQALGNESLALKFYKSYIAAGDSIKEASNIQHYREMRNELTIATGPSSHDIGSPRNAVPGLNDAAIPAAFMIIVILMAFSVLKFRTLSTEKFEKKLKDQSSPYTESIQEVPEESNPDGNKNARRVLSDEISNDIFQRLLQLLEGEKYFLRSELSLHELAVELDTNTSYLSRVINERTGGNFHSLLNKYRIEEACRQLSDHRQQYLSIEGIALSAGFKSKSAFNVAFRKFKGMTPSEFCGNNPT
jgi:AraC-like DNA-binding protein